MEQLTHANDAKKRFLEEINRAADRYKEMVIQEINASINRGVGCIAIYNRQHILVVEPTISYLKSFGYRVEYDIHEGTLRVSWE